MMGMGFLKLNKVLRRHKWKRADRKEELEEFHAREDRIINGCLIALIAVFALAILVSVVG